MRHFAKLTVAWLLLLVFAIGLGADASVVQKNGEAPGLKPGEVWALVLLSDKGTIVRSLVVRVSATPASSCRGGKWNKLEVLDELPRRDPGYKAEAAYEVSAKEVSIDLSISICDAYLPLHGEISELGIEGTHGTLGIGRATTTGRFYGIRLPRSLRGQAN
jgi:hypothetical protein